MKETTTKKINQAIKLLQTTCQDNECVELAYSGGKDSDVILQLAKEAGIKYRAIYKNSTIDPPGTIAHVIAAGAEIIQPKESFFQLIERKGFPSRMTRFCCDYLKEYKVLDKAIIGVRQEESQARANRYQEPTQCRLYGKERVQQIFPILNWTAEDERNFILDRQICCHKDYYDDEGVFHPERRLGCMGCPLKSRGLRIKEFQQRPKLLKAWLRAGFKYWESHPHIKSHQIFNDVYELFCYLTFCDNMHHYQVRSSRGYFGSSCKQYLEDSFQIQLF